jgi:hypothetical protein
MRSNSTQDVSGDNDSPEQDEVVKEGLDKRGGKHKTGKQPQTTRRKEEDTKRLHWVPQ